MIDFDQEITAALSPRFRFLKFIVMFFFAAIVIRLWYLQIFKGDYFFDLSENNRIKIQEIPAPRGIIYDRNGKVLVNNIPSFDISLLYSGEKQLREILPLLSKILNLSPEEIINRVKNSLYLPRFKPIKIKLDVTREELGKVEFNKIELPNVVVEFFPKRTYPWRENLAHVIGFLGEINQSELNQSDYFNYRPGDFLGKSGIEKSFEKTLKGQSGWIQFEVDALGRKKKTIGSADPVPGKNIFLTIDLDLQLFAEQVLGNKSGVIIAQNPNTGEIIAFASHPSFDPNLFSRGISSKDWKYLCSHPKHPLTNKGIQGVYPPGSLLKIITAIAGLEEGKITPDTRFFCSGSLKFGNRSYRCWKKEGHGSLNLLEAIEQSCDVYFYQVGNLVGINKLAYYSYLFGLGAPTGLGLEGEKGGLVPTTYWKEKALRLPWQKGETLSCSIGQGFYLTTPLQMLVLISAIANGGKLYSPFLVKKIIDPQGNVIKEFKPKVIKNIPVSFESIKIIKEGLRRVVEGEKGTAKNIKIPGIEMGGKTGTAQVVGLPSKKTRQNLPEYLKDHAWFVAFAPFNNPEIAVVVLVEHGGFGSMVAAPMAREIIRHYLNRQN